MPKNGVLPFKLIENQRNFCACHLQAPWKRHGLIGFMLLEVAVSSSFDVENFSQNQMLKNGVLPSHSLKTKESHEIPLLAITKDKENAQLHSILELLTAQASSFDCESFARDSFSLRTRC